MQARVIDHILEESRIFTPELRRKFFALIRSRIEKSDGPRPRWMPRNAGSPSEGERPREGASKRILDRIRDMGTNLVVVNAAKPASLPADSNRWPR